MLVFADQMQRFSLKGRGLPSSNVTHTPRLCFSLSELAATQKNPRYVAKWQVAKLADSGNYIVDFVSQWPYLDCECLIGISRRPDPITVPA